MHRRPVSFPWHRALSVVRNISDISYMTIRALLSLLAILLSILTSRGDVRVWRLGEAEGMPQTRVYCVIQTHDGYIWMATRDGLVRFDGAHARVFKTRPSDRGLLPGNHFRHIYENDRGELCAKIEETYYLFDRLTERFDTMPQPLSPPRRPRIPDSITAAIQGLPQFRGHETRVLFNDRQDGWWVESPEGISRVLFTTTFPTPVKDCPEREEAVRGLMRDRSGRVWTADKNGYVRVSSDSATRWLGPDGRLHDTRTRFGHNVYTMAEHDGGLWLGTKPDGLYRLRGDSLTHMDGIAGNAVYGIIADMKGHIFVGTYDAGLSVITDPRAVVIDEYVGTWIPCLIAPCAAPYEHYTWLMAFLGFALFRVIDIFKPLGCRKVEEVCPGGWGVMLDDVLAGFYALVIVWVIKLFYGF